MPDARFGQVIQYHAEVISNYNGLIASIKHEFTVQAPVLVQVSHTYGHALDEVSNGGFFGFTSGSSLVPQDPSDLRGAYGPAENNLRTPKFKRKLRLGTAAKGSIRGAWFRLSGQGMASVGHNFLADGISVYSLRYCGVFSASTEQLLWIDLFRSCRTYR